MTGRRAMLLARSPLDRRRLALIDLRGDEKKQRQQDKADQSDLSVCIGYGAA